MVVKFESGMETMNNSYRDVPRKVVARTRLAAALDRAVKGQDRRIGELFYEVQLDFAVVWTATPEGWVLGLEVVRVDDEWSVTEIDLRPYGKRVEDPVVDPKLIADAIEGVKAKASALLRLQRAGEEQLQENGVFITANLAACRDKGHRKTNFNFAAIAAAYAGEVQAGNRKATQAIANLLETSTAVAAQWVKEARKRRLLTMGEPGRASGSLTPLGALYTSPDFPGFGPGFRNGVDIGVMARSHGVSERDVWTGLDGEGVARSIDVWVQNSEEFRGGSKKA
jgi:hypothetical protein